MLPINIEKLIPMKLIYLFSFPSSNEQSCGRARPLAEPDESPIEDRLTGEPWS